MLSLCIVVGLRRKVGQNPKSMCNQLKTVSVYFCTFNFNKKKLIFKVLAGFLPLLCVGVVWWWCVFTVFFCQSLFPLCLHYKRSTICLQTNAVAACWQYRIKIENNYYTARHHLFGGAKSVLFVV